MPASITLPNYAACTIASSLSATFALFEYHIFIWFTLICSPVLDQITFALFFNNFSSFPTSVYLKYDPLLFSLILHDFNFLTIHRISVRSYYLIFFLHFSCYILLYNFTLYRLKPIWFTSSSFRPSNYSYLLPY